MVTDLNHHELQLVSNPESISEIEPFVEDIHQQWMLRDELFANMLVAVTEAVNNAIIHGNLCNEGKKVFIRVKRDEHFVSFTVRDEGEGFDYSNIPDPTAPENLEKPTGRGVFLMKELSDMVIFSDNGSTVEIQFYI